MNENRQDDLRPAGNDPGRPQPPPAILVIAEERETCASFGSLFARHFGCRILEAQAFDAAMEIYATTRINLVVLAASDRERGLAQLRSLLGSDRSRRAAIVVAVCAFGGGDHVELLREGADDAIPFPCSEPELLARVGRRLAHERERQGQRMARKYSLAGDLTGAGLGDLVTLFEQGGLTGSLELLTHRGAAQLLFRDGQVKHASFANVRGRSAFFELLREREGQFEFVPGDWVAADASGAVEGPNAALLLEGSQAMDENPDELPGVAMRRKETAGGPIAPALKPDPGAVEEWRRVVADPAGRGEIRLLARDQVSEWTAGPTAGQRLRMALVTDVACGLHVLSQLAAPLALEEVAGTLRRPPAAPAFTWTAPLGQTLEILLLDQERLRLIVDNVRGSACVLILAPSYGDFLTLNVTSRTLLKRLLQEVPPLAILGVGNGALEGQVRNFLKLAKIATPARFLQGTLWNLEITPRTLIEEAIQTWSSLPAQPESRAA